MHCFTLRSPSIYKFCKRYYGNSHTSGNEEPLIRSISRSHNCHTLPTPALLVAVFNLQAN